MPRPGPSVTSGADLQPGSDSLFPSGFTGGGARPSAGSVGTGEIADGSVAAADLNLSSVATALAARSEFSGTYVRAFPVGFATGVAATDTAAITAQANAAFAAGGGDVVLQTCVTALGTLVPYAITSAGLPVLAGVRYRGVPPVIKQQINASPSYLADGPWDYGGGTVLQGDGTAACFSANATDQSSPATNLGLTEVRGFAVTGVGFDNFTYGIQVGAKDIMGVTWGYFDQLFFKSCSVWSMWMVNFAHCTFGDLRACKTNGGFYFGSKLDGSVFQPGNSRVGELYVHVSNDGRDTRLVRGVVLEATGSTGSGDLNEMEFVRVQVNAYNRPLLTVTATLTSGSTSIAVPDGTKYGVGMPVMAGTTIGGFTSGQTYVVLSVSGNNLTLANGRSQAAISAGASGSLTLNTYGYANVEVVGTNTGSKVQGSRIMHIDAEGAAGAALYTENLNVCEFAFSSLPTSYSMAIVGRAAQFSRYTCMATATTDFDSNSTSSTFNGYRSGSVQRALRGQWFDTTLGTNCFALTGGTAGQQGGELQARLGALTYPTQGMGERIFPRDTALTLAANNTGDVIFNGGSGVTFTLPTIVTDTSPAASHVGAWFDIWNVSANSLTIVTDGTQTFNKVGAKTSTTLAAGSSMKIVACKDNGGNLFWAARQTANTLP